LLAAGLMALPVWFWHSGQFDHAGSWLRNSSAQTAMGAQMSVGDVLVQGRRRTSRKALTRALGVRLGTPILALDLTAARQRIEALPWVAAASIERRLPDTIHIRITERRPIARWHDGKHSYLVDHDGFVIRQRSLKGYSSLPMVTGRGAPQAVGSLLDLLKSQPKLATRIVAARRLGQRRWDLIFDKGVVVMLPEDKPRAAFGRLARLATRHRLLDRGLVAIDMRLPGRVVLRAPGRIEPPLKTGAPERST